MVKKYAFNSIDIMKKNDEIFVFVAKIMTKWHLLGLKALLSNVASNQVIGLVLLQKHSRDGYLINKEEIFFVENMNIQVFDDNIHGRETFDLNFSLLVNQVSTDKTKLNVISPQTPWVSYINKFRKSLNIRAIVIDEGVGSYNSLLYRILNSYAESKQIIKFIYTNLRMIFAIIYLQVIKLEIFEYAIFKRIHGNLIPRKEVVESYKKLLLNDERNGDLIVNQEKYVIFFMQPMIQDGAISKEKLESLLDELAEVFLNKGYSFYVKLHPRDKNDYYLRNAKVIDKELMSYSAEELIGRSLNKPNYVIAFWSTVIINMTLFWDIPSISVNVIYKDKIMSNNYKRAMKQFNRNFISIIRIPNNINQLENIIS